MLTPIRLLFGDQQEKTINILSLHDIAAFKVIVISYVFDCYLSRGLAVTEAHRMTALQFNCSISTVKNHVRLARHPHGRDSRSQSTD